MASDKRDGRGTHRPRGLSKEDQALWRKVTESIEPLEGRFVGPEPPPKDAAPEPKSANSKTKKSVTPAPVLRPKAPPPAKLQPPGVGLDRRSSEKLRKGRYPIEGRLDLHGMTVERAHGALNAFISASRMSGKRVVLIITGKGRAGGEGVLRRQAPDWLSDGDNRTHVLATHPARPADGGSGALYVLLRRIRE
ncbi:MAG: Smr/MutS family protein [Pseudomonadota bacterium]